MQRSVVTTGNPVAIPRSCAAPQACTANSQTCTQSKGRRRSSARNATLVAVSAQQQENGESPAPEGSKKGLLQQPSFYAVVALAIFDAGLVDAGFSGDWSRIGAISKETEVLLQQSCAVVVPVSIAIMAFWWKGRQQGGAKD